MPRHALKRFYSQIILTVLMSFCAHLTHADQLPPISGANYNGERVSWNALSGATGYNIYLDFQYIDTVVGSTSYVPAALGEYRIAAFDDSGRFSPLQIIDDDVVPTTNIALVTSLPNDPATQPPEMPENSEQLPTVTGVVFDGNVVSWDSLDGSTGYNVYLDFSYLDTVKDSTSYTPTISGEYRIVAFDDAGRFSPLQIIDEDVVPTSNFVLVNLDDVTTPAELPPTPQNVSLTIYSRRTAELFWDRPSTEENVVFTEVYRDGVLLGTSPGNSFYDDTRGGHIRYRYELIAVDGNGLRSLPAILNPGALDGDVELVVSGVMGGIADVIDQNPHFIFFSGLRALTGANNPLTLLSTETVRNEDNLLINRRSYACDADTLGGPGTLTIDEIDSRFGIHLLDFDDCTIDTVIYEESMSIVGSDIGGYYASYEDLYLQTDDFELSMRGKVSLEVGRAQNFARLTFTDFDYGIFSFLADELDDAEIGVLLNQVVTGSNMGDVRTSLTTNLRVSAPWTNGEIVEAETLEQFTGADIGQGAYVSGSLRVLSTSGDSLIVNADSGDAGTWSAVLNRGNDSFGVTGDWDETGYLPCLSAAGNDSALSLCDLR